MMHSSANINAPSSTFNNVGGHQFNITKYPLISHTQADEMESLIHDDMMTRLEVFPGFLSLDGH
jgi:hypothetical protein